MFSAARAWFMFKVFGAKDVQVLDGGLPLWEKSGHPLDRTPPAPPNAVPSFGGVLDASSIAYTPDVEANLTTNAFQVVDARSRGRSRTPTPPPLARRFLAAEPEPRPTVPGGHVPGGADSSVTIDHCRRQVCAVLDHVERRRDV
jgi:thiosulfate/3-mercaptopyruvate sulfurtransferase